MRDNRNYDILANYDVMLFPTFWSGEGFPGIVIDALISGLPIIATDWNINKEVVIDKKTGMLIPPHDIDALVNAMKVCINQMDYVKEMSKHCQKQCMSYDMDSVLSKNLFNSYIKKI